MRSLRGRSWQPVYEDDKDVSTSNGSVKGQKNTTLSGCFNWSGIYCIYIICLSTMIILYLCGDAQSNNHIPIRSNMQQLRIILTVTFIICSIVTMFAWPDFPQIWSVTACQFWVIFGNQTTSMSQLDESSNQCINLQLKLTWINNLNIKFSNGLLDYSNKNGIQLPAHE